MLHPSTQKLIDQLAAMTGNQKINWTSRQDDIVGFDAGDHRVVLTAAPVELVIYDRACQERERATLKQLKATATPSGRPYADLLSDIKSKAMRAALDARVSA